MSSTYAVSDLEINDQDINDERHIGHRYPSHYESMPCFEGEVAICGYVKKDNSHNPWKRGDQICVVCLDLDPTLKILVMSEKFER